MTNTTIAIPQEFKEELNQYKGSNYMERLKRWAKQYENDDIILHTQEDVKREARKEAKKTVREEVREDAML